MTATTTCFDIQLSKILEKENIIKVFKLDSYYKTITIKFKENTKYNGRVVVLSTKYVTLDWFKFIDFAKKRLEDKKLMKIIFCKYLMY